MKYEELKSWQKKFAGIGFSQRALDDFWKLMEDDSAHIDILKLFNFARDSIIGRYLKEGEQLFVLGLAFPEYFEKAYKKKYGEAAFFESPYYIFAMQLKQANTIARGAQKSIFRGVKDGHKLLSWVSCLGPGDDDDDNNAYSPADREILVSLIQFVDFNVENAKLLNPVLYRIRDGGKLVDSLVNKIEGELEAGILDADLIPAINYIQVPGFINRCMRLVASKWQQRFQALGFSISVDRLNEIFRCMPNEVSLKSIMHKLIEKKEKLHLLNEAGNLYEFIGEELIILSENKQWMLNWIEKNKDIARIDEQGSWPVMHIAAGIGSEVMFKFLRVYFQTNKEFTEMAFRRTGIETWLHAAAYSQDAIFLKWILGELNRQKYTLYPNCIEYFHVVARFGNVSSMHVAVHTEQGRGTLLFRNKKGKTVADIAYENRHLTCLLFLKNAVPDLFVENSDEWNAKILELQEANQMDPRELSGAAIAAIDLLVRNQVALLFENAGKITTNTIVALLNWVAGYPYLDTQDEHGIENNMRGILAELGNSPMLYYKNHVEFIHESIGQDERLRQLAREEFDHALYRACFRLENPNVQIAPPTVAPPVASSSATTTLLGASVRFIGGAEKQGNLNNKNDHIGQQDFSTKSKKC